MNSFSSILLFVLFEFAFAEVEKLKDEAKEEEEEPFLSTLDIIVLGLAGKRIIEYISFITPRLWKSRSV